MPKSKKRHGHRNGLEAFRTTKRKPLAGRKPGWMASTAKAFIEGLRKAAWKVRPGYDDCSWEAPEPQRNAVRLSALIAR